MLIFIFTFLCGTSKLWPQRSVKTKIYVDFYNWFRFQAVGYRAWIIIKIGLQDFSSEVKLLIFLSIWAVLLYIFVLFIYSFSQVIDLLHNMQSVKWYNSNLGLILTSFFAQIYFCGWKLLFGKICRNFLGSSPLFQQEGPEGGC